MSEPIKVLDHGFVEHIESWGRGKANVAEAAIIEAARQSTQGAFRGWERDEGLLKFLYEHKHNSPFEFAGMTIQVQAPIAVFREWHRHRTQSYNEMSARYAPLPDVNYVPSMDRIMMVNDETANKQAAGVDSKKLTLTNAIRFQNRLASGYVISQHDYQCSLSEGVAKELARLCVPVGRYSRMYASANLRNWLAFLTLRMQPDAQWEIRQFANVVGQNV
ncbi:MAG: FAD-dependent thymidylate synthase, partial [Patescibacteria group bacterium]|nr:FAD-dependent thymidylate synthase [Patescibacteria group bacterium]